MSDVLDSIRECQADAERLWKRLERIADGIAQAQTITEAKKGAPTIWTGNVTPLRDYDNSGDVA